jgi:hypothetical protein
LYFYKYFTSDLALIGYIGLQFKNGRDMKNKDMMFGLAALLFATASFAQGVEYDDMYFNSKDRATLNAQRTSAEASYSASTSSSIKKSRKNDIQEEVFVNPTDSYSARNVNPEFAARSNSETALADDQDYFVSNYKYKTSSDINQWNNNFNSWYGNPMYGSNYYGSSINAWNSPYYGSYYDPFGNPWSNPYYRSGWSSSYSFYMGNSWNYGWGGMGYGYGYPYGNSWSSWGYGGYGYCYPGSFVMINNNYGYGEAGPNVAYGKRATRSGMVTTPQEGTNYRTRTSYVAPPSGDRPSTTGGRVSSQSNGTQKVDYYNRGWRTAQQGQSTYPTRNSTNSSWGNSNYDRSSSGDSYNRSSGNNSYSAPARSSYESGGATRSSAPASSGSGGRTRGRD